MSEKTCSGELATSSSRTTDLDSTDFSQLSHVADARAEALRDAGFRTVHELATAEVDEVTSALRNAGEKTAQRIKGSAQGHSKMLEQQSGFEWGFDDAEPAAEASDAEPAAEASDDEPASDEMDSGREARNVLLLAGKGVWREKDADEAFALIDQALEAANAELQDGDTIGFPADSSREATLLENYQHERVRRGELLGRQTFEVRDEDRTLDDDYNDNWSMAYEARDERMFEWADVAVVVEAGEYTNLTLSRNPELGGARTYVHIEDDSPPLYFLDNVDSDRARALTEAGFDSMRAIADATAEEIASVLPDVSENLAAEIRRDAHKREYGREPPEKVLPSYEQTTKTTSKPDGEKEWYDDDYEDDWYDGADAPDEDPGRGPGHVWVADQEREPPEQYKYEGGEPGDNTLL